MVNAFLGRGHTIWKFFLNVGHYFLAWFHLLDIKVTLTEPGFHSGFTLFIDMQENQLIQLDNPIINNRKKRC